MLNASSIHPVQGDVQSAKDRRLSKTVTPKVTASRVMTEDDKVVVPKGSAVEEVVLNEPVSGILRKKMEEYANLDEDDEPNAFFVADLGEVVRQHKQWNALMPRVEPFFAIKCNPNPMVLKTLVGFNTGFDCASKGEIAQVLELGVNPSNIIFANPCKQGSHIKYASSVGVRMMTFDNKDELYKIKQFHKSPQLVLRILVDDSKSICKFGVKFGASLEATQMLLETAQELELEVIGVSFHVGSGCFDANAFGEAVVRAKKVFDQAESLGMNLHLLDIGGGFPGADMNTGLKFSEIAAVLGPAIEEHFPDHDKVRVIAEPGRYYVCSAFTLACCITSRRVVPRDRDATPMIINTVNGPVATRDDQPSYMYYINDGVYGSFNCILFDHVTVTAYPMMKSKEFLEPDYQAPKNAEYYCSIWGPTCDSMDCLTKEGLLPEMNIGDWIRFDRMGAYTMCAASEFNGFLKSKIIYTNTYME